MLASTDLYSERSDALPLVRLPRQPPADDGLEARHQLRDPPRPRILRGVHGSAFRACAAPGFIIARGFREPYHEERAMHHAYMCLLNSLVAEARSLLQKGRRELLAQWLQSTSTCASCPARRKTRVLPICQPSRPVACSGCTACRYGQATEHVVPIQWRNSTAGSGCCWTALATDRMVLSALPTYRMTSSDC